MKRLIKNISILFLVSYTGMFFSCHRSIRPSWDTNLLAPIVNASLSINNLLTSSYLKSNPDNSVNLVYSDSLYNVNMDSLLHIRDTTLNYYETDIIVGTTTVTPGFSFIPSTPTPTLYNIGSVQLKKATIETGYLNFSVRNHLPQPVDYLYKVLNVTKDITDTLEVDTVVAAGATIHEQISLAGYNVDFTGPTHNAYNTIITNINVVLDPKASPVTVNYGDTVVSANVSFSDIVPYFAKGYFGTTTKTFGPQSVGFPLFNKIVAGSLMLQNVNVSLTLQNGFGVDARVTLSQLTSKNKHTGSIVNLTDNEFLNKAINVNHATQTYNSPPASPVNTTTQTFTLNPSNSNILAWIENLPDSVIYSLMVETDPIGNVSGSNDFAYYGYGIKSYLNITVPLSLIANNLTLMDTVAVNFSGSASGNAQQVKNGTLTLYAVNGFPFSAGMQLYLLNNTNSISDSLFIPPQTIAAGIMNANGVVVTPQNSTLVITLNAAKTQELLNVKNVIIQAKFNMGCLPCLPPQYRTIYNYYLLNLKLVGNIDYEINGQYEN